VLAELAFVVLVGWLLFSFLVQFPPAARKVKGIWNYFLPHWSLFTAPLMYLDVRLCYREQISPSDFTPWQPVPHPARPWTERLWQPRRRFGKLVGDAAAQLVGLRRSGERHLAPSTVAYRILYAYARHNVPAKRPIQFAVLAASGLPAELPRIIFQSDVHGL
jgi:hypothetical protein